MGPIQIVLIALVCAGVWAIAEVALTVRRARATMGSIDRTVEEFNDVIEDVRLLVRQLDSALDALQPALDQVEPLLKSVNVATEALSANLIEVEAIVRDVSAVSGAAAGASSAVSAAAASASDAVQRFFDRRGTSSRERAACLVAGRDAERCREAPKSHVATPKHMANDRYYTYRSAERTGAPYPAAVATGDDKETSDEL